MPQARADVAGLVIDPSRPSVVYAAVLGASVFKLLPSVTVFPDHLISGEQITIRGAGFSDGVVVTFNGIAGEVVVLDDGTLRVTVPSGLAPGPVHVEVSNEGDPITFFEAELTVLAQLLAQWRFEEPSGNEVLDSSGNGHHGILQHAEPAAARGHVPPPRLDGGEISLQQLGDGGVTVSSLNAPEGAFSWMAWVRNAAREPSELPKTVLEFTGQRPSLAVGRRGNLVFFDGTPFTSEVPLPLANRDVWTHLAYTWDGSAGRLFINGIESGVSEQAPVATGEGLSIGMPTQEGVEPWNGWIDDVRVYSGALDEEHLRAIDPRGVQFAQYGAGAGLSSDILITSSSTTNDTLVVLEAFGPDGELQDLTPLLSDESLQVFQDVESGMFRLGPLQTVTLRTRSDLQEVTSGSVHVRSTSPVSGVIRFSLGGVGVAGVGSGNPVTSAITPVRRTQTLSTGIAVRNPEREEGVIKVTLKDASGMVVAGGETASLPIPGEGRIALFIEQLFPQASTEEFTGTLCIESGTGVVIVAIELGGPGEFTTLPVGQVF